MSASKPVKKGTTVKTQESGHKCEVLDAGCQVNLAIRDSFEFSFSLVQIFTLKLKSYIFFPSLLSLQIQIKIREQQPIQHNSHRIVFVATSPAQFFLILFFFSSKPGISCHTDQTSGKKSYCAHLWNALAALGAVVFAWHICHTN